MGNRSDGQIDPRIVIKLDGDVQSNDRTYVAGQEVSGRVTLIMQERTRVPSDAIKLILATKITYYRDRVPNKDRLVKDRIFAKYYNVVEPSEASQTVTLNAGKNCFRFSLHVPDELPSQVYCHHGISLISHALFAVLQATDAAETEGSWPNGRLTTLAHVKIQPAVSVFNAGQELLNPSVAEVEKSCVKLVAEFTRRALVPGQKLEINVRITNKRKYSVKTCLVQLIQEYQVHTSKGHRTIVEHIVLGPDTWTDQNSSLSRHCSIQIPSIALQPTHSGSYGTSGTYAVSISYRVDITVTFRSFLMSSMRLSKPVFIGNHPSVHQMAQSYMAISQQVRNSGHVIITSPLQSTPPPPPQTQHIYPSIAGRGDNSPPSYNSIISTSASAPPCEPQEAKLVPFRNL